MDCFAFSCDGLSSFCPLENQHRKTYLNTSILNRLRTRLDHRSHVYRFKISFYDTSYHETLKNYAFYGTFYPQCCFWMCIFNFVPRPEIFHLFYKFKPYFFINFFGNDRDLLVSSKVCYPLLFFYFTEKQI